MTSRHKKQKTKRVSFKLPNASSSNQYSEDDDDNICRCICGDNDFTAKRPWIQCTDCEVWQHNDCMNVSLFEDELEDHYWCEQCAEEKHVELLAAVARGERPWEGRVEQRLQMKGEYEGKIRAVMKAHDWLWETYEPQPSAVAGDEDAVPPKRVAPLSYVEAVQSGLQEFLDDSPMQSLRELAEQLDPNDSRHHTIRLLKKKAAQVYDESDFYVLGIFAELLGWAEKGTLNDGVFE